MRYLVLAVGKPKLAYAAVGVEEYSQRLRPGGRFKCEFIRPSNPVKEGAQLLERSKGCFRIVLDERGKTFSSLELAHFLQRTERDEIRKVAFLIAGSDGHVDETREKADLLWSLSRATLPHELALVVVLEQLYRAQTILSGHPYHRE